MFAQVPDISGWVQWVTGLLLQWILPLALLAGLAIALGAVAWSAVWKVYAWMTSGGSWFKWDSPGDVFWSGVKILAIVIGCALVAPLVTAWVANLIGYSRPKSTTPSIVGESVVTPTTPAQQRGAGTADDPWIVSRGQTRELRISPSDDWRWVKVEGSAKPFFEAWGDRVFIFWQGLSEPVPANTLHDAPNTFAMRTCNGVANIKLTASW